MHIIYANDGTELNLSREGDHVHLLVRNNSYTPTADLSADALRGLAKSALELADVLERRSSERIYYP